MTQIPSWPKQLELWRQLVPANGVGGKPVAPLVVDDGVYPEPLPKNAVDLQHLAPGPRHRPDAQVVRAVAVLLGPAAFGCCGGNAISHVVRERGPAHPRHVAVGIVRITHQLVVGCVDRHVQRRRGAQGWGGLVRQVAETVISIALAPPRTAGRTEPVQRVVGVAEGLPGVSIGRLQDPAVILRAGGGVPVGIVAMGRRKRRQLQRGVIDASFGRHQTTADGLSRPSNWNRWLSISVKKVARNIR